MESAINAAAAWFNEFRAYEPGGTVAVTSITMIVARRRVDRQALPRGYEGAGRRANRRDRRRPKLDAVSLV
jgi:hypothetical protein